MPSDPGSSDSCVPDPREPHPRDLIPPHLLKDNDALSRAHSARWRPGLGVRNAVHHTEVFARPNEGAGAGFALSLALDQWRLQLDAMKDDATAASTDDRVILWVQDRAAIRANGRPYRAGLPEDIRHRIVHVAVEKPEDALFALEEAVRCRDIAFVIGEIAGNPRALDFTASRRLSLTAERHGVALWLVRFDAGRDLSSARMRWDVRSAPSPTPRWNAHAPGTARWHGELFRARAHAPGKWIIGHEHDRLAATKPAPEDERPAAGRDDDQFGEQPGNQYGRQHGQEYSQQYGQQYGPPAPDHVDLAGAAGYGSVAVL